MAGDDKLFICPTCIKKYKEDKGDIIFVYKGYWTMMNAEEGIQCPYCNNPIVESPITKKDFATIARISTDRDFIQAMMDLKEKDIIEYQLKLSQFKEKVEVQKQIKQEAKIQKQIEDNTVKCPRCGSTSITSGARGVNWTWGLIGASKTVNRCGNCGHTWKPRG